MIGTIALGICLAMAGVVAAVLGRSHLARSARRRLAARSTNKGSTAVIVVKVELWSAVDGERHELARMVIDNTGGTVNLGNYRCRTLRGRSTDALNKALAKISTTGTQREGQVVGHPRLREHVWNLVAKGLEALGYGNEGKAK